MDHPNMGLGRSRLVGTILVGPNSPVDNATQCAGLPTLRAFRAQHDKTEILRTPTM